MVLGYPRNDLFFNPKLLFTDVGQKLHLKDYKTVILYAPTFRDKYQDVSPFSPEGLHNINTFLHQNNSLLVIKKHPLEQNISIPSGLSNIIDVSDQNMDIQELPGHKSPKTTMIYTHITRKSLMQVRSQLDDAVK